MPLPHSDLEYLKKSLKDKPYDPLTVTPSERAFIIKVFGDTELARLYPRQLSNILVSQPLSLALLVYVQTDYLTEVKLERIVGSILDPNPYTSKPYPLYSYFLLHPFTLHPEDERALYTTEKYTTFLNDVRNEHLFLFMPPPHTIPSALHGNILTYFRDLSRYLLNPRYGPSYTCPYLRTLIDRVTEAKTYIPLLPKSTKDLFDNEVPVTQELPRLIHHAMFSLRGLSGIVRASRSGWLADIRPPLPSLITEFDLDPNPYAGNSPTLWTYNVGRAIACLLTGQAPVINTTIFDTYKGPDINEETREEYKFYIEFIQFQIQLYIHFYKPQEVSVFDVDMVLNDCVTPLLNLKLASSETAVIRISKEIEDNIQLLESIRPGLVSEVIGVQATPLAREMALNADTRIRKYGLFINLQFLDQSAAFYLNHATTLLRLLGPTPALDRGATITSIYAIYRQAKRTGVQPAQALSFLASFVKLYSGRMKGMPKPLVDEIITTGTHHDLAYLEGILAGLPSDVETSESEA